MKQFAVIGLGRFGARVAAGLYQRGAEVVAIDEDLEKVEAIRNSASSALCFDASDEDELAQLNIPEFDAIVVAIGRDIEGSILITALLKQLGARMVISRASTALQARILDLVGASGVIYPEEDIAARLVRSLISPHVVDHIELAGDLDFALVKAPRDFYGKTLRELDVRKRYGVTVVAVRRSSAPETEASRVPSPDYVVREGDLLYLVGSEEDLEVIAEMEV
jgi:trk system potassium uptake protein TrkA